MTKRGKTRGFTLIELLIGMALTMVVMGAALMLFKKSVDTSNLLTQRTEMQAELRAASGQIMRDLNQAGTATPLGGAPIPSAATGGADPQMVLPVDLITNATATYPLTGGFLYKVFPGNALGLTTSRRTDLIYVTYVDPNLNWSAFPTDKIALNGSSLTMPAADGAGNALSPAMGDPQYGLNVGDVMLLQNSNPAVGVVTAFDPATRVITFGADPININQTGPAVGNIKAIRGPGGCAATGGFQCPITAVSRLMVVTYFIQKVNGADGPDTRLMRQIGARPPAAIAEHIEDLQLTYDLFNAATGVLRTNLPAALVGGVPAPNQIKKINLTLTVRSPRKNASQNYDRMSFSTSVGPRNLSFSDRYR